MLNDERNKKLIKDMTPLINKLSSEWFPANKKSPEGYSYACSYCDMGCGRNISHDPDCLYQCAKDVKDQWVIVDEDDQILFSPLTKKRRTKTQILQSKNFKKMRIVLSKFFSPLIENLVPFKYTPENDGVICDCNMDNIDRKEHNKNCVRQKLARIISDYYNPDK